MCLIPTDVVREIGMSLPIFIKWDDAEFGLRAAKSGYPHGLTARRRRLACAVDRQGRHDRLAGLPPRAQPAARCAPALAVRPRWPNCLRVDEHADQAWSCDAVQRGRTATLGTRRHPCPVPITCTATSRPSSRRSAPSVQGQDDAHVETDPRAFPPVRRAKPPKRGKDPTEPKGLVATYGAAAAGILRQIRPVRTTSRLNPEAKVAAMDSKWSLLSQFDSAVVTTADGAGAFWYKRDRKRFADLMRRSLDLHRELALRWDELARSLPASACLRSPALTHGARHGATAVSSDASASGPRRSDSKRVIIHVGAPKTGTTFLQGVLWRNRDDLEVPDSTSSVRAGVITTAPVMTSATWSTTRKTRDQTGPVRGTSWPDSPPRAQRERRSSLMSTLRP